MFSSFSTSFPRNEAPLFWIRSWPVRLVPLLVVLYSISMVVTAVLFAAGRSDLVQLMVSNSSAVMQGQVWRLITYPFVNPPTFWFALEMVMLYYFGRVVELGLGSTIFAFFYAGLVLVNASILQLAGLAGFIGENSGVQVVNFAIFAAFVAMHPKAPFFFGLAARWMLLALLTLSSLQLLADHQWLTMIQFIMVSLSAILFMKWRGYREPLFEFPKAIFSKLQQPQTSKPTPTVVSQSDPQDHHFTASTFVSSVAPIAAPEFKASSVSQIEKAPKINAAPLINIDQLLEKISQSGMTSLTEQEKGKLEEARIALLERDKAIAATRKSSVSRNL